tara:strand:+ start:3487 stop:4173 length:687 start_codon:yes stop_codon:yes gene_type:complete
MSDINENIDVLPPSRGRTWADVFVGTSYIAAGAIFLVICGLIAWYVYGTIPTWFFIAIIGSALFIPFLVQRAKDGADLYVVSNEPFKLTEYRIGKKTGLDIDGKGIQMVSNSGVYRTFLTGLDIDTLKGKGSAFGGFTQIDQMRDLTTLQKVIDSLESTLKENRISSQEVGIEVEKQSIKIVDWALKAIYGAIIPNEITDAFGIDSDEETIEPPIEQSESALEGFGDE